MNSPFDAPAEHLAEVEPGLGLDAESDLESRLVAEASAIIEAVRQAAASSANQAMTLTFWRVGQIVGAGVLAGERAEYGKRIVVTVSRQLVALFGRSYDVKTCVE